MLFLVSLAWLKERKESDAMFSTKMITVSFLQAFPAKEELTWVNPTEGFPKELVTPLRV